MRVDYTIRRGQGEGSVLGLGMMMMWTTCVVSRGNSLSVMCSCDLFLSPMGVFLGAIVAPFRVAFLVCTGHFFVYWSIFFCSRASRSICIGLPESEVVFTLIRKENIQPVWGLPWGCHDIAVVPSRHHRLPWGCWLTWEFPGYASCIRQGIIVLSFRASSRIRFCNVSPQLHALPRRELLHRVSHLVCIISCSRFVDGRRIK